MEILQHLTLWHWLGFGAFLTTIELLTQKGYCFWLAIIAGIVGLAVWLAPGFIWHVQLVTFFVAGSLVNFLWYRALHAGNKITRHGQDNFNIAKQYIGHEFVLKKQLKKSQGKIELDGRIWHIRCKDNAKKGDALKVTGHDGVVLICSVIKAISL